MRRGDGNRSGTRARLRYRITVVGSVPSDLCARICRLHAEAIAWSASITNRPVKTAAHEDAPEGSLDGPSGTTLTTRGQEQPDPLPSGERSSEGVTEARAADGSVAESVRDGEACGVQGEAAAVAEPAAPHSKFERVGDEDASPLTHYQGGR